MAKGEFDMLYSCAWGAMIFFFHKSTSLEEGQKKTLGSSGGEGLPKNERKK